MPSFGTYHPLCRSFSLSRAFPCVASCHVVIEVDLHTAHGYAFYLIDHIISASLSNYCIYTPKVSTLVTTTLLGCTLLPEWYYVCNASWSSV